MLSKTVAEWTKQWKKEGLEKGMEKGMEKGLEKGLEKGRARMAKLILRMLEKKFGPLNEPDKKRVLSAKETILQKWGEILISASTIEEIFKH